MFNRKPVPPISLGSEEIALSECLPQAKHVIGTICTSLPGDYEPVTRIMAKRNLERPGYTVITATKSIETLRLVPAYPDDFSVVITDMTMPDMTGDN